MTLLDTGREGDGLAIRPKVLRLSEAGAQGSSSVGAKAANLARAHALGHPVLAGFVITIDGARSWDDTDVRARIRDAWGELTDDGEQCVVVRSSSTAEDTDTSSQAGRFTSVLRVKGWSAFVDAVDDVLQSADAAGVDAPMAVLVQPWLDAEAGGVAFGRDPVTGSDDIVVSAVSGGPHTLVSGDEQGTSLRLTRHGRVQRSTDAHPPAPGPVEPPALGRRARHQLARIVRRLGRAFGGPQDVEWAIDRTHRLWLLQNRPITTAATPPSGPVLGPGPIAETFPEQLSPLEEDLWLDPLRDGLSEALSLSGTRRRGDIERSPVIVSVAGRPAVDLGLIGAAPGRRGWWRVLDPRPGARRVSASWRVGRLRAALPNLAEDVIHDVDESLLDVPALSALSTEQLGLVLRNAQPVLRALHGHEILIGMLLPGGSARSLAALALSETRRGRAAGLSDDEIIERHPATLSLVPPRVGPPPQLPPVDGAEPTADRPREDDDPTGQLREALRLRARWVHELTARAAWELAQRLRDAGRLHDAGCIRHLRLEEVHDLVEGGTAPPGLRDRLLAETPPLPAAFRLREDGGVVGVHIGTAAVGAGGGRAEGTVHHGDTPPPGSVLVVGNLSPRLAPVLPNLVGLIAETGSPLSHVAILARELGIATVVGYPEALTSFDDGDRVVVDGVTGEVTTKAHTHPAEDSPRSREEVTQ
jgi:pyruvate,water dikinase